MLSGCLVHQALKQDGEERAALQQRLASYRQEEDAGRAARDAVLKANKAEAVTLTSDKKVAKLKDIAEARDDRLKQVSCDGSWTHHGSAGAHLCGASL